MIVKHNNEWRLWKSEWGADEASQWQLGAWHWVDGDPPTREGFPEMFHPQMEPSVGNDWSFSPLPHSKPRPVTLCFDIAHSVLIVPDSKRGYWGRTVLMVSLPQLLLRFQDEKTAAEVYHMWLSSPCILRTAARGQHARPDRRIAGPPAHGGKGKRNPKTQPMAGMVSGDSTRSSKGAWGSKGAPPPPPRPRPPPPVPPKEEELEEEAKPRRRWQGASDSDSTK